VELAARVARTSAPIAPDEPVSWLTEHELAVEHDGIVEPTELGITLGAGL
jgi:hypothetical protein